MSFKDEKLAHVEVNTSYYMCRKTNGKKYEEGTSSVKESVFPYPVEEAQDSPVSHDEGTGINVEEQGVSALVKEINHLQSNLHQTYSQLEQANNDLVEQVQVMERMSRKEKEEAIRMRDLKRENEAMQRRLANLEGSKAMTAKPGPKLKDFANLTPRDQKRASKDVQAHLIKTSAERNIHPAKLSAYLTYRFIKIK